MEEVRQNNWLLLYSKCWNLKKKKKKVVRGGSTEEIKISLKSHYTPWLRTRIPGERCSCITAPHAGAF